MVSFLSISGLFTVCCQAMVDLDLEVEVVSAHVSRGLIFMKVTHLFPPKMTKSILQRLRLHNFTILGEFLKFSLVKNAKYWPKTGSFQFFNVVCLLPS